MRARFPILDDVAGMAAGGLSVAAGLREEMQALVRGAVDEALRRLELVRREEVEVLEDRVAALEAALGSQERPPSQAGTPSPGSTADVAGPATPEHPVAGADA